MYQDDNHQELVVDGEAHPAIIIACLAFSITISAQGTQPEAGRYISKTFKVCPFNVDGLPKKFGFINVNPDGKGAEGAKTIG